MTKLDRMTNEERIVRFLVERPGVWFDDDQLSKALDIRPRQQVNQICRRLAADARILRESRGRKIANTAATELGQAASGESTPTGDVERAGPDEDPTHSPLRHALQRCALEVRRLGLSEVQQLLGEQLRHPDPRGALLMTRTVCEALMARGGVSFASGLQAAIEDLTRRRYPGAHLMRTRLNTVRVLGNQAAHGTAALTEEDALAGLNALLAVLRAEATTDL